MTEIASLLTPDWPAPKNIRAFSTTRLGGVSEPPFDSLNLGKHVGDKHADVDANRARLPFSEQLNWLTQVHGNQCAEYKSVVKEPLVADAAFTRTTSVGCTVMTADCLPILLCDVEGSVVAAVHAGWRGLANDIIARTVKKMAVPQDSLLAWLGPCIGPTHFEVGQDVRECFSGYPTGFEHLPEKNKFLMDIQSLASIKLTESGVDQIYAFKACTYSEADKFFSYRRASHIGDPKTGRMVTAIIMD